MKARGALLLLVICAVAFGFGLYQLFKLRFETGDVFPAYSSMRADPLGTMALCESLERMPSLSVRRDFSPYNQLPDGKNTTYLHLAALADDWEMVPVDLAHEIDAFVAKGGRLAITFLPEPGMSLPRMVRTMSRLSVTNAPAGKKPASGPKASPVRKARKVISNEEEMLVSVKDKWGWELGNERLKPSVAGAYEGVTAEKHADLPLPDELEWHSPLIFTNLDTAWQVIYARGTNPVVVERKFGTGSIVMATDSFFVSNEAMLKDRHADVLAWLVGPNTRVVFDEAHLGLVESPGVASLMRQYRLQWLGGGLLLLAGLFIWKNALSFGPSHPEEAASAYVPGKDAAAGFVNLLRRNIPAKDVLPLCFEEWSKSLLHGNPHLIARVDQAQSVLEKENALPVSIRKPAETYRRICEILGRTHLS